MGRVRIALDTNLLAYETPRRLLAGAIASCGGEVVVLPTVYESTVRRLRHEEAAYWDTRLAADLVDTATALTVVAACEEAVERWFDAETATGNGQWARLDHDVATAQQAQRIGRNLPPREHQDRPSRRARGPQHHRRGDHRRRDPPHHPQPREHRSRAHQRLAVLEHRSGRSRIARADVFVAGADEILAGKLHGCGLMAYRDIYDAAVCVLKAPRAWERAVELCVRRSGRGGELIGKIRTRMDRVSREGLWLARRSESIVGATCPQAWASGPELVAESLDRFDGRGRRPSRNRARHDGPEP